MPHHWECARTVVFIVVAEVLRASAEDGRFPGQPKQWWSCKPMVDTTNTYRTITCYMLHATPPIVLITWYDSDPKYKERLN